MLRTEKLLGCCTLCRNEVYNILERYPSDHPLAGEPRKLGRPLANARKARIRQTNGMVAGITLCDQCQPTPDVLPKLWDICMRANAQQLDPEYRKAAGMRKISAEHRESCIRSLQGSIVNPPLLVEAVIRLERSDGRSHPTDS